MTMCVHVFRCCQDSSGNDEANSSLSTDECIFLVIMHAFFGKSVRTRRVFWCRTLSVHQRHHLVRMVGPAKRSITNADKSGQIALQFDKASSSVN